MQQGLKRVGYQPWRISKPEVADAVDAMLSIYAEYEDYLPLTNRQVFYRMVASHGYPKTEAAATNLGTYIQQARRAGMVPFDWVRDERTVSKGGHGYKDEGGFLRAEQIRAKNYRRDRQQGQSVRFEIWCESVGMVSTIADLADEYTVPVYSGSGFPSVTAIYEVAQRAGEADKDTVLLSVGDFDPSGTWIDARLYHDADAFLWADFDRRLSTVRVALTDEQVKEYDLPTAPPNPKNPHSRGWAGQTCQLEALTPPQLNELIQRELEQQMDMEIYGRQLNLETKERKRLVKRFV